MQIIDADNEASWPDAVTAGLKSMEEAIAAYHRDRRRIDLEAEENVALRINRPRNLYEEAWEDALALTNDCIVGRKLLGFHATRLTAREQDDVIRSGLKRLSGELFEGRLLAVQAEGLMNKAHAASLRARHQVRDDNRAGKTWFCFNRSMVSDEWGMRRFFQNWGGEALYNSHEDDEQTGPLLQTIGTPCIVVAGVQVETIESFMSIGQRLLNLWAARRGISTGHAAEFEGYSRIDNGADNVVRVLRFDEPEFLELTRHDQWKLPIMTGSAKGNENESV